uniref:Uncharacterized protein n=1 Tax=Oryza nivara TaxID=4536 RepID=A0A0E0IKZ1_ORYNI
MATRNAATSQQPAECEKRGAISLPNSGRRLRLLRLKQRRGAASRDLVLDRILQPRIPTGNRNRSGGYPSNGLCIFLGDRHVASNSKTQKSTPFNSFRTCSRVTKRTMVKGPCLVTVGTNPLYSAIAPSERTHRVMRTFPFFNTWPSNHHKSDSDSSND